MSVTRIEGSPACILGEGPHWDIETQSLYYTDILGKSIHRYDPATGKHYSAKLDGRASVIIPIEGAKNEFITTETKKVVRITWDGVSDKVSAKELLVELQSDDPTVDLCFNDAKVDPSGRLWIGTLPLNATTIENAPDNGAFYCYDAKNKSLKEHIGKITVSNGLDWIGDKLYYVDSVNPNLREYSYDDASGTISYNKTVFSMEKHNMKGIYDGLTADVDGNLWIARWEDGTIIKIDPRKPETLLDTIKVTTDKTTSVAFGGPNLDELYVTSATMDVGQNDSTKVGGLFRITGLGTRGLPMRKVKL